MSYDVGEATEGLENYLWRRWSDGKVAEWALLGSMMLSLNVIFGFLNHLPTSSGLIILTGLDGLQFSNEILDYIRESNPITLRNILTVYTAERG